MRADRAFPCCYSTSVLLGSSIVRYLFLFITMSLCALIAVLFAPANATAVSTEQLTPLALTTRFESSELFAPEALLLAQEDYRDHYRDHDYRDRYGRDYHDRYDRDYDRDHYYRGDRWRGRDWEDENEWDEDEWERDENEWEPDENEPDEDEPDEDENE